MTDYFINKSQLGNITRTVIKTSKGDPVFLLVGCWGTRGDVLSLYAMDGQLIASIKQSSFSVPPKFDLYEHFTKVGSMHRIFSFQKDIYYIKKLHWMIASDLIHQEYTIFHFSQKIMEMKLEMLFSGDFYRLSVFDDTNAPLSICIVAIIDYWLYNRKKNRSFVSFSTPPALDS